MFSLMSSTLEVHFLDAGHETQNRPFIGCHGNMMVAMETGPVSALKIFSWISPQPCPCAQLVP